MIMFEGMQEKYNVELNREWTVLKNKKCVGTLQTHYVRARSKPVIMEMDSSSKTLPEIKTGRKTGVYTGCHIH